MARAILKVQSAAGYWREVARCEYNMQIIANRLDDLKAKYKMPVRAEDSLGRMIDMR